MGYKLETVDFHVRTKEDCVALVTQAVDLGYHFLRHAGNIARYAEQVWEDNYNENTVINLWPENNRVSYQKLQRVRPDCMHVIPFTKGEKLVLVDGEPTTEAQQRQNLTLKLADVKELLRYSRHDIHIEGYFDSMDIESNSEEESEVQEHYDSIVSYVFDRLTARVAFMERALMENQNEKEND